MNDNERTILRGVKALTEHKAIPDKSVDSLIIDAQVTAFLSSGGEIQAIPSNLQRTPEETALIAASQRNSLNSKQLKAHNKRMKVFMSKSAELTHLTNRTELSSVVK